MRRYLLILLMFFSLVSFVFAQETTISPVENGPRYAQCDACGYCPSINPEPPKSWYSCQKCLYPDINPDPQAMESLKIDPKTNTPISPMPGRMYTFLGCLGGSGSFTETSSSGAIIQKILNIIFSTAGGIAFLYLLYGSFVIVTSQADPERLNYGKRIVSGAIIGLVFTLTSVLIVNFIGQGVLKIPGFSEAP